MRRRHPSRGGGDAGELNAVQQPIYLGTLSNQSNVVALHPPGSFPDPDCTGTLVTPTWVLTAKHCFGDVSDSFSLANAPQNWRITFETNAGLGNGLAAIPDDVVLFEGNQIDNDWSSDLALVHLSQPVPSSVAVALFPPLDVNGCAPTGWAGRVVGFSDNAPEGDFDLWFENVCPSLANESRRSFVLGGWSFDASSGGKGQWNRTLTGANTDCAAFTGLNTKGDSGGPLFRESDQRLCGVASGYTRIPFFVLGVPYSDLKMRYTAIDSSAAVAWLQDTLPLKADGSYREQCASPSADIDEDLVPDACDVCPRIWDPDQLDGDADGIGDACDAEPSVSNPGTANGSNANYEYEVRQFAEQHKTLLFFDAEIVGDDEDVLIRPSHYNDDEVLLGQARNIFRAFIDLDVQDEQPTAVPALTVNDGSAPAIDKQGLDPASDPQIVLTCNQPINPSLCRWVERNQIRVRVPSTKSISQGDQVDAEVGLRWCECETSAADTSVPADRTDPCGLFPYSCRKNDDLFDQPQNSGWLPIQTYSATGYDPADPTELVTDERFSVQIGAPESASPTVSWDFTSLPGGNVIRGPYERGVVGVLWSSVRSCPGCPPMYEGNAYSGGNGRLSFQAPSPDYTYPEQTLPCRRCPWGVRLPIQDLINPWDRWNSVTWAGAAGAPLSEAVSQVLDRTLHGESVLAVSAWSDWPHDRSPGSRRYAVEVSSAGAAVRALVGAPTAGETESLSDLPASPAFDERMLASFDGARSRLFTVGEGSVASLSLGGEAAWTEVENSLAHTWRAMVQLPSTGATWYVRANSPSSFSIGRFDLDAGGHTELWTAGADEVTGVSLSAVASDTLAVAFRQEDTATVALFYVDADGAAHGLGVATVGLPLLSVSHQSEGRLHLFVEDGGIAHLQTVELDQLSAFNLEPWTP